MAPDPEILSGRSARLERRRREPDDLTESPRRPAGSFSRRQWLAAAIVVAAVSVGWYVDHRIGQHETASIVACDRDLRAVSHEYDARMGAMYDYVRPSLSESGAGVPQLLSMLMAEPAKQVLPAATAASGRCGKVHVLSWHSSNLARRNADRAYASALVRRLRDVAGDQHGFQINDGPLSRLRAAAGIPEALGS